MNLFLMLNYEMVEIPCEKYYLPIMMIDLRPYKLICQDVNSLMILIRNPRVNIDLMSSIFSFFFDHEDIEDSFYGEVQSDLSVIYNLENKMKETKTQPFILFTEGYKLIELLIYFPNSKKQSFLKEIAYKQNESREGECPVCMEQHSLVNLHNNEFQHELCWNCLFKVNKCPLCRINL
jgi:hypothetical protein